MTTIGPIWLQRLELQNFRGFEELTLDFERDLTVLVGANGAGKSTVLDGIVAARSRQIAFMDLRSEAGRVAIRTEWRDSQDRPSLTHLEWIRSPEGELHRPTGSWQPHVLFVYRVNRHVYDLTPGAGHTRYSQRWSADSHWDDASASYQDFFHWLKALEDIENEQVRYEGGSPNPQLAAVKRAITALLPELQEIRVRRHMPPFSDKPVLMLRKGDIELPFDALSEGERTTIAMVGDIARRLVLLGEGEDPLQTAATVLIDEIEQHAHPGWQRQILRRLRHTFPNLQIITTTHSPVIVSEVEPRHLRVLRNFALVPPEHGPGRDANAVLEDIFDVSPRREDVQKAIDDLASAIDDDDLDRADQLLAQLDELVPGGADPDILYYRDLLARLREP